jgi:hypothetical protein
VIVAINRGLTDLTAGITIAHDTAFASADVYTLTSHEPNVIAGATLSAVGLNAFSYLMPAYSVSVLTPKP